ncbi:transferrin-binding protein-like solute binding protein [Conchiformibius steedae]|nr:transferrin-binding protein-like solute binding protein [Conchiformibius steedae]
MTQTTRTAAMMLTALLTISACGGGGSSDHRPNPHSSAPPPPQTAPHNPPQTNGTDNKAQQPPVSSAENPSVPPAANPTPNNDRDTFNRLALYGSRGGLTATDTLKLVLPENGQSLQLALLKTDDQFVGQPFIQTLRDADKKLVGYIAHANVNQVTTNDYGEKQTKLNSYYLQHADSSQAARPNTQGDVRYNGTMHFRYTDSGNLLENQTATVDATYHGSDKTLSMELISDRYAANRWYLYDQIPRRNQNGKVRSERVPVGENGSVSGYLFYDENGTKENTVYNGTFNGGFYGKNGSVLTGVAVNESGHGDKWEGVIGATAESAPK